MSCHMHRVTMFLGAGVCGHDRWQSDDQRNQWRAAQARDHWRDGCGAHEDSLLGIVMTFS